MDALQVFTGLPDEFVEGVGGDLNGTFGVGKGGYEFPSKLSQ